jgi:lysozyme
MDASSCKSYTLTLFFLLISINNTTSHNDTNVIVTNNLTELPLSEGSSPVEVIEKKIKVNQLKNLNSNLVTYIKDHEGFVNTMYYCPSNRKTIGYGHLILPNEKWLLKSKITTEQADSILYKDILMRKAVIDRINYQYNLELNSNQKASLVHFIYSLGEGTLYKSSIMTKLKSKKKLNRSDFTQYSYYRKNGKLRHSNYMKKIREWEWRIYNK